MTCVYMTLTTVKNFPSDFRFSTTLIIVGYGKKIKIITRQDFNEKRWCCCSLPLLQPTIYGGNTSKKAMVRRDLMHITINISFND
jgi:hypothetical protein